MSQSREKLASSHRRTLDQIVARASTAQSAIADAAVAESRRLVRIRTGALERTIAQSTTGLQTIVSAGTGHAADVEFGSPGMAPRPYMMPAVNLLRARFATEMAGKLK